MPTPILDALDAFFRHEVSYKDTIARLKAMSCPSYIIAGLNPPSLIRDLSGEPYKSHRDKQAAKARLEAAAPELLEALKKILNHVEDLDVERVPPNMCTLCHTYRMIGHNAIAKAEGLRGEVISREV